MVPNSKVFVGGLPSGSKPQELRRLFENYGVVTECDIMNRCGFVHMETPQMAETAIRALHNTTFKGSVITVEPGRPKDRNGGGGGGGGPMSRGGPGGPPPNPRMGGNMGAGPPRGNFGPSGPDGPRRAGGPPGGPDRQPGGREGNAFNAGPMRRDRSAPRRDNEPYTRNNRNFGGNGGSNNLQDNFQGSSGGGYRNYDSNSAPKNFSSNRGSNFGSGGGSSAAASNYGGNSGGPGGNFSVGNQDKRGFVLPNQQFESNRNPGIGVNQASRGGFGNKVNPFSRPMPMNATPAGAGSASAGGFVRNPFSKPMGGGNMNSQPERNFSGPGRGGGRGGIQSGGRGGMQGGGRGGFPPNQNYNEAFPPLGASRDHPGRGAMMGNRGFGGRGGGFNRGRGGGGPHMDGGMGNPGFNRGGGGGFRNGPPHRDNMMMNRR